MTPATMGATRTKERLPPSGGAIDALRGLVSPLHFVPRAPTFEGLSYGPRYRGVPPLADVYLPSAGGARPSVILVHGGGFLVGSRQMKPMRLLSTRLVDAGFAVMSFDYRLILRGGRLDEIVSDVATAARWWRAQRERFALDVDRVAMIGLSAGAALTMLATSTLPADSIERLVGVFGVYDFAALEGRRAALVRRLLLRSGDPARWLARSPLAVVKDVPQPTLLIHGTGDALVPHDHTRRLAERREALGLPIETLYVDGAPHAFFNERRHAAAADTALAAITRFLA